MRIEPEQVRAVVDKLDEWGVVSLDHQVEQDLVDEFDVAVLTDPGKNKKGPHSKGSSTSRQAALGNYPRSGSQRQRVLEDIWRSDGGVTRDEIAARLNLPDSSTDARVWELKRDEWVQEGTVERKTRNGSMARVLVLTPLAQDIMRRRHG